MNNNYKEVAIDLYFINYMMFSDVDFEEYRIVILSDIFLYTLETVLEANIDKNLYTKEMYEKLGELINYISSNIQNNEVTNIINLYNMLKEYPSNEFYNNEFLYKYSLIDENLKNKSFIWNKRDIEESVKDDYSIILYLNLDFEQFKEIFIKKYVGNINYLLFLNKFILSFPKLILDEEYKKKILYTLDCNKLLENKSDMFIKMNDDIYNKIIKTSKKDADIGFNLKTFEELYYNTMFEKMIVLNEKVDIDYTDYRLLNNLYSFIKIYSSRGLFNASMKSRLIDIMSNFRYNIKNININEYNEYLGMINSMQLNNDLFTVDYLWKKNLKKQSLSMILKPYLVNEYIEMIDLDFTFLQSLLCDEEYDEKYLKHFIYNDDYYLTIERYLKECPLMFRNKEIYDKVIKTINKIMDEYKVGNLNSSDYYKQYKKLLKKLEKGKY